MLYLITKHYYMHFWKKIKEDKKLVTLAKDKQNI